ncbi:MAG: TetR/AcrR family transcriptional regulator [Aeromicrobium sp.]
MGRPRAIDDEQLAGRLATVFRSTGYDGASVSSLAESAGLRSASLYHRFPDGKVGMATAVLDDVERQFGEILEPLGSDRDPADGVREMARRVAVFFADGRLACVLDSMSLGGAPADVKRRTANLARGWIAAMALASVRSGATEAEAARRGQEALVRIEGALVLARLLDDTSVFTDVLAELPDLLTAER